MEGGVESVKRELVEAATVVTERFQADDEMAINTGFETLKSMNARLTAIRKEVHGISVQMEITVSMIEAGVDEVDEQVDTHTQCAEVMRLIDELTRDVRDFVTVD